MSIYNLKLQIHSKDYEYTTDFAGNSLQHTMVSFLHHTTLLFLFEGLFFKCLMFQEVIYWMKWKPQVCTFNHDKNRNKRTINVLTKLCY